MGQLKRDCPHCDTNNTAFVCYGEVQHTVDSHMFTAAFRCMGCFGGITAEIHRVVGETPFSLNGDIDSWEHLNVIKWYPIPESTTAPAYLPENIESFYIQAANCLKAKNFDASAIMSRKTLEASVKKIAPNSKGNLYERIEHLAQKNLVTADLKDWAHLIRGDGNFAAHDDEPVTPEFAKDLLSYAEVFLMYTLTMPGMIRKRRPAEETIVGEEDS